MNMIVMIVMTAMINMSENIGNIANEEDIEEGLGLCLVHVLALGHDRDQKTEIDIKGVEVNNLIVFNVMNCINFLSVLKCTITYSNRFYQPSTL